MDMRMRIEAALKAAMRARDVARLSTLRLVSAAIKDREIALRATGEGGEGLGEGETLALLGRMVKQRQESARAYAAGGRPELAQKEEAEIAVIAEFLPQPLAPDEVDAAIDAAIVAEGAASLRDMGRVMAALKAAHTGRMDFAAVGPMVKARLA